MKFVVILVRTKGYAHFEPARATNKAAWDNKRTWWQKKGSCWPIFVMHVNDRADTKNTRNLQNAAQKAAERLMLNPNIIKFARKYAPQILSFRSLHVTPTRKFRARVSSVASSKTMLCPKTRASASRARRLVRLVRLEPLA